jgi:hypothetical protein
LDNNIAYQEGVVLVEISTSENLQISISHLVGIIEKRNGSQAKIPFHQCRDLAESGEFLFDECLE